MFNALAARYQKEARYRSLPSLPAADVVVEARQHQFGAMLNLSNRDQPVQRVVWSSLSRFGTYGVVTVHALVDRPWMGREWPAGAQTSTPLVVRCPRPIDETCAASEDGAQFFVVRRVAVPKTQWQL